MSAETRLPLRFSFASSATNKQSELPTRCIPSYIHTYTSSSSFTTTETKPIPNRFDKSSSRLPATKTTTKSLNYYRTALCSSDLQRQMPLLLQPLLKTSRLINPHPFMITRSEHPAPPPKLTLLRIVQ